MFTRYTSANIQVIVEINPAESRKVLLSNRDGLIWKCTDEVEQFCDLISKETLSAFRDKSQGEEIVIGSARKFTRKIDTSNIIPKAEGNQFIFNNNIRPPKSIVLIEDSYKMYPPPFLILIIIIIYFIRNKNYILSVELFYV